jgi:hypothetical protein
MTDSHVIFINPDTSTPIYSLFNTNKTTGYTLTTDENEATVSEIRSALADASANDIVYILYPKQITGLTDTSYAALTSYLSNIFVTTTTDDVDIFYLTVTLDNCLNRTNLTVVPTDASISGRTFSFSVAPNGSDCIATTKTKLTEILELADDQEEKYFSSKLSALVADEKIVAATSQPLFVVTDLNKHIDSIETLKAQTCRIERNFGRAVPNTENLSFFWFVLGVTTMVTIAWGMSYYMPRKYNKINKDRRR